MIIKLDNRECDLIPLIERRIEAISILEADENIKQIKPSTKHKSPPKSTQVEPRNNGCLVPLHIFQNVDVVSDTSMNMSMNTSMRMSTSVSMSMSTSVNADVTGDAGEIDKIHKINKLQLPVGDVILEDNSGNTILIFERKTLYDLAASIKDGRYNEQSFRLDKEKMHNQLV